jgi:hypothetical protein
VANATEGDALRLGIARATDSLFRRAAGGLERLEIRILDGSMP